MCTYTHSFEPVCFDSTHIGMKKEEEDEIKPIDVFADMHIEEMYKEI